MRRILTLFCAFAVVFTAFASENRSTLLRNVRQYLSQLGRYRVEFRVDMEGYNVSGEYIVDGADFYANSDSTVLYVARGIKHEVNLRKREVVIDTAANLGGNLVSNPADIFAVLERDFEVISESNNPAMVELRERGSHSSDTILVETDGLGLSPKRITYRMEGGSLVIELLSVKSYSAPLPSYTEGMYVGFEVIDFRD